MSDDQMFDPKGLIKDAFAIAHIRPEECRSIFLDWALSVPAEHDTQQEVARLLAHYGVLHPADHPMLQTLHAAQGVAKAPRRRGGRKARLSD